MSPSKFNINIYSTFNIIIILIWFFYASRLGTVVVSVHVQTYTNPTHTTPHHAYTNKPTTTLRSYRVIREITESIHGTVDDGRVAFPL
jgi:hypothetical protein